MNFKTEEIDRTARLAALKVFCRNILDEIDEMQVTPFDKDLGRDVRDGIRTYGDFLHWELMKIEALANLFRERLDLPEPDNKQVAKAEEGVLRFVVVLAAIRKWAA